MSKNQLSTFSWRDSGYDRYTPVTEKEAYELSMTVKNLFEENEIYYDVKRTMESRNKPKASIKKVSNGVCLRIGVTRQKITTATIEPIEGRFLNENSFLCWD